MEVCDSRCAWHHGCTSPGIISNSTLYIHRRVPCTLRPVNTRGDATKNARRAMPVRCARVRMNAMGQKRDDDVTRRRRDAMMRRISFVRARAFSCARSRRRAISTESSSSSASSASWTPRQHDSDGDSERARGTNGRRPWTLMEFARARRSEEMPLGDAARAIGEALAPMATAAGTAAREAGRARGRTAGPGGGRPRSAHHGRGACWRGP